MKVISVIYMSRRNFWCMSRGDSWHLNFQLQKVDWEPSGRQNWGQMMEFWKILYIHFIRDPKGMTYVRFILKIESDAKMIVPNHTFKTKCSKIIIKYNELLAECSKQFGTSNLIFLSYLKQAESNWQLLPFHNFNQKVHVNMIILLQA